MDERTTISRRKMLAGVAATAGAAALTGALPRSAYAASARAGSRAGTTTVTYWDNFVSQAPWVDGEIKIFEQMHPNITIKKTTQYSTNYPNLLALAIKSGNQPDVFVIPFTPTLAQQVASGWLAPLNTYAGSSWYTRFPKGTFNDGINMFNGKLYTAPLSGNGPFTLLYINNRVFRKAGLVNGDGSVKVPRTWDDMTRAAEAIAKKGGGSAYGFGFGNQAKYFLGFWVDMLARAAGMPSGVLETGNIDYRVGASDFASSAAFKEALNQMLAWKKAGYVYPNAMSISDETARAFFEHDRYGMLADGIWCESEWKQHGFTDYTVTTLPSPTGTPKAYFYYHPGLSQFEFAMSPRAKNPEAAWLWLDHLYSVAAGKRWVQGGNDISIFPENNNPQDIPFKPFAQYVGLTTYALSEPTPTIRNPQTSNVIIAPAAPDIFDTITGVYTGQISGTSAIFEALAKVDENNNAALASGLAQARKQGHNVSRNDYTFPDWNPRQAYYTRRGQA